MRTAARVGRVGLATSSGDPSEPAGRCPLIKPRD